MYLDKGELASSSTFRNTILYTLCSVIPCTASAHRRCISSRSCGDIKLHCALLYWMECNAADGRRLRLGEGVSEWACVVNAIEMLLLRSSSSYIGT